MTDLTDYIDDDILLLNFPEGMASPLNSPLDYDDPAANDDKELLVPGSRRVEQREDGDDELLDPLGSESSVYDPRSIEVFDDIPIRIKLFTVAILLCVNLLNYMDRYTIAGKYFTFN